MREWAVADRLRREIEAAGWLVVDRGTDFRLEPASPPNVEVGGEIRYGRSDAVPSRLDEPATGIATVVVVIEHGAGSSPDAVGATSRRLSPDVDLVVVGDGIADDAAERLRAALAAPHELVRTSAALGRAAALNAGIRRARAPIVIVLDPSIEVTGDVVSPLVEALADPTIALAGPFGLRSDDLHHFEEVTPGFASNSAVTDAVAIQGGLMAFRRADAVARGPLDEAFRFHRNLDIWWSLVLRDEGESRRSRRAVVVPNLPVVRREPSPRTSTPVGERDRLSKRNFYRVLDRFRARLDLAVGGDS